MFRPETSIASQFCLSVFKKNLSIGQTSNKLSKKISQKEFIKIQKKINQTSKQRPITFKTFKKKIKNLNINIKFPKYQIN